MQPATAPRKGFNVIEMTIVLAIVAVLSAITLPRAGGFVDSIEVRGAVTEIDAIFSTARHAAIARGSQSVLEIDPELGVMMIRVGADTLQRREVGAAHGVSIDSNRTSITYSPIGVGYGAANLTMIVSRKRAADTLYVSRLGRVRH